MFVLARRRLGIGFACSVHQAAWRWSSWLRRLAGARHLGDNQMRLLAIDCLRGRRRIVSKDAETLSVGFMSLHALPGWERYEQNIREELSG